MRHLSIDIETKSSVDIGKAGLYKYAQSPDFGILLFAYKADEEEIRLVDMAQGEDIPTYILDALQSPGVVKHAYNAAFEWYCLNQAGYTTPIGQWRCTMALGLYCGYPAGLERIGEAISLPQDKRKLIVGKTLIRYFCVPCKPTKTNGGRSWNLPRHAPEKCELLKKYCRQDVATENEILKRLSRYPLPAEEERLWQMDVLTNVFGVRVDTEMLEGALFINEISEQKLTEEAVRITGLANPNSEKQLASWLYKKTGDEVPDMRKETVSELLKRNYPADVHRMLQIRQQMKKTSIEKYVTMEISKCEDDRIRGVTQFYGAGRTGRWAGRLVQMQNLPRNYITTLDYAREIVKKKNYAGLKLLYGNVPDTLSQLIRTAFIPSEGNHFVVADFSAIEARVIAWLAGEQWVNDVFATHGKIYEATASQMFHVPIERIVKGNPEYSLRQKGKVATLALGYQGSTAALIQMGALDMGLQEDELPDIVQRWRDANPRIRDLWWKVQQASVICVQTSQPQAIPHLLFALEGDLIYGQSFLTVQLPSGRKLFYPKPFISENKFGRPAVHYYGAGSNKKWAILSTYGGKMTENIVQAIARDCLAEVLKRLYARGLQVVFHVHDEVIIDAPRDVTSDQICSLMAEPIPWAKGLVLKGAGFEGKYYMKD